MLETILTYIFFIGMFIFILGIVITLAKNIHRYARRIKAKKRRQDLINYPDTD